MSHGRIARILASACVALIFGFMAETVDAQRRGGGGRGGGRGGGGRSISRAGPASGGSFRPSGSMSSRARPSTMPQRPSASTRPSGSTRPSASTRPATPQQRPATRPGGETRPGSGLDRPGSGGAGTSTDRPTRPSERPGSGTENREDWQQHADAAREDRQKYQKNAREDWQDFAEESGAYYYGGYPGYYGHYGYHVVDYDEDYNDWGVALAGFAVGTALTSAAFSSMQNNTACTLSEVTVNGVRYFKCGSTWYNRVIDGTNVNYVIVSAPPGY
jgi:hypothetical protein